MRLPDEYAGVDAEFVILPVPYECNPTYGEGARHGPKEIINAAEHLEYYDEQFDVEPFVKGVRLMNPLTGNDPETMVKNVAEKIAELNGKFVITLGGDHAVTIGAVQGLERAHKDFSVIILDAHADFRYVWNGSQLNHACAARRLVGNHAIGVVGVRTMDIDEAAEVKENADITIIKAYDYQKEKLEKLLEDLNEKIYISVDVDVFDPAFLRNTGTPEPGGFLWNRVMEILQVIFSMKKVIGADIVEFAPKENFKAEAYSLAKLCYKMMALQIMGKV